MTEHKHEPNALIHESSPYLLQHAHNPVDWLPWGDKALEKAHDENKPVFLSIGYATCHWCHVMERESFENEDVAAYMNEHFVSIKVDREERPDIDNVYMAVTQGLNNGQGGWPMSVWMTPEKLPFMAGTYFPPEDRFGRTGFLSVLKRIIELWSSDRDKLVQQANDITEWLRGRSLPEGSAELSEGVFNDFAAHMKRTFDARYGGFDQSPKFPTPHRLQALLRHHALNEDAEVLGPVEKTLTGMSEGGIHDQIGGGFHRYSTDREWLTPHFEKMLYDQALLTDSYLDAFQITGKKEYAETARSICRYVLRDLRDDGGAFHSAEDADSEGEEGKFYVWTTDELHDALGDDAELAGFVWGCAEAGNFFDESSRERTGGNILHLPRPVADSAKQRRMTEQALREKIFEWQGKLFELRCERVRPLLDDKVLTDWNGLMIGAMARAGVILEDDAYLTAAQEAADFTLTKMQKDGRLLHRYRKGQTASAGTGHAGILGYAEDYAFLLNGLFELYQADFNPRWLTEASRLAEEMIRLFFHEDEGLLRTQGSDVEDVMIAPNRDTFDGAVPSSNSAGAYALIRLGRLLQNERFVKTGTSILESNSQALNQAPAAHAYALLALDWLVHGAHEVVIAGERNDETAQAMLNELQSRFTPRAVVVLNESGADKLRELIPFIKNQTRVDGKTAAYVCENYTCKAPVKNVTGLVEALGN